MEVTRDSRLLGVPIPPSPVTESPSPSHPSHTNGAIASRDLEPLLCRGEARGKPHPADQLRPQPLVSERHFRCTHSPPWLLPTARPTTCISTGSHACNRFHAFHVINALHASNPVHAYQLKSHAFGTSGCREELVSVRTRGGRVERGRGVHRHGDGSGDEIG